MNVVEMARRVASAVPSVSRHVRAPEPRNRPATVPPVPKRSIICGWATAEVDELLASQPERCQMSAEQDASGKQTKRSVREILAKAERSAHATLKRAAPAVQRSAETSMEAASKGFTATMKSIDTATAREQFDLLKAYRRVLSAQVSLIDSRLNAILSKGQATESETASAAPS